YDLYPFNDLEQMLKWGIPTIRFLGRDYRLGRVGEENLMTSVPAVGPSAARLLVRKDALLLTATLVAEDGQVLVKQDWKLDHSRRNCPNFSSFPAQGDQPRALLISALGLPAMPSPVEDRKRKDDLKTYDGEIIAKTMGLRSTSPSRNSGCPSGDGWVSLLANEAPFRSLRGPFRSGDKLFYPHDTLGPVHCQKNSAFIYNVDVKSEISSLLLIEKRRLDDFQQVWRVVVRVDTAGDKLETGMRGFELDAVTEQQSQMTIQLIDPSTGRGITVLAKPAVD
ncbi:hypothetical protein, partial [Pseudomonas congelans]|uniref:hypothetical protein n=1 Tax=Pseudomonas congelans TaxID=200452 RepID=UPI001F48D83E